MILATPPPLGLLQRLGQALPKNIAIGTPSKSPVKPQASPTISTATAWQTPPRAPQAPQALPQQAAPIDPRMQRAVFDRLSPEARGKFMREGGRLRD